MPAISVIVTMCLIAVFAYALAPDDSPYANRMIPELRDCQPGFNKLFLKLPLQQMPARQSFSNRLFAGRKSSYYLLPVNSFFFARDSIVVGHYVNKKTEEALSFPLDRLLPPSSRTEPLGRQQLAVLNRNLETHRFYLGTDQKGRDTFSRLLIATRTSVAVGIFAALISLCIAFLLGTVAGYSGGRTDDVVKYLINMLRAIPAPLLVFAITLCIGRGFPQVSVAIGLTVWVSAASLIRRQISVLRGQKYIQAAKTLGLSGKRIIFRHILPNLAGPLLAIAASNVAAAVLMEAGLSFLGIGVQPPVPSWGLMIREHYVLHLTSNALPALLPGIAIIALAYAFHVLGKALCDEQHIRTGTGARPLRSSV